MIIQSVLNPHAKALLIESVLEIFSAKGVSLPTANRVATEIAILFDSKMAKAVSDVVAADQLATIQECLKVATLNSN